MKNIDGEVADFHQKMAKSMHSLLKAFTEGFEAMDKEAHRLQDYAGYETMIAIELGRRQFDRAHMVAAPETHDGEEDYDDDEEYEEDY